LLLGLYYPQKGRVLVEGIDATQIPDANKRKLFGYVEQSFHLVSGTVAEQISLFDASINRQQVETAAKLVGLHENILELEQGYDTPAEKASFSQGQFQLLSIARAVAAEPKILLLDEITANLDSETERRVLEALERACKGRTVLSISHRLHEHTHNQRLVKIDEQ
jgi:ABC-type multidrug transport system fused ATPase/permease subunit